VVEIGAGSGQVTSALAAAGHPVLALEVDPYWAETLRRRHLPGVRVVTADVLAWQPAERPVVLIGNLPFGAGTPILRHVLALGPRTVLGAVFLLQLEYVRKRAGRWGGNLFNAQWWPWYEFSQGLVFRRDAFRPVPRADAATLIAGPRGEPLLSWPERGQYQQFTARVFTTGHMTIGEAVRKAVGRAGMAALRRAGIAGSVPVTGLTATDWAALYREHAAALR
jgi:23S rRNA (adenine-N6)-dimethyltransferase